MTRTCSATASDVAKPGNKQEVYEDTLFRDSKGRIVKVPLIGVPVADTHAHLDMLQHPGLALARCAAVGVDFVVTITDPTEDAAATYAAIDTWRDDARGWLDVWATQDDTLQEKGVPHLRAAVGCHPHNAKAYTRDMECSLIALAGDPLTAAIGEIGLDYHYDLSPRDQQKDVFRRQIELAHRMDLPIALHLREAHDDGYAILRAEGIPLAGALLHCFNLDYDTLEPFLALGCHVAYGGPLTFKKSDEVRDAAARTPIERMMTETDAPFMAPEPLRGTVCGPEDTVFTADRLAATRVVPEQGREVFFSTIYENARAFFDRPPNSWQQDSCAIQALMQDASDGATHVKVADNG